MRYAYLPVTKINAAWKNIIPPNLLNIKSSIVLVINFFAF